MHETSRQLAFKTVQDMYDMNRLSAAEFSLLIGVLGDDEALEKKIPSLSGYKESDDTFAEDWPNGVGPD